jgi:predicted nucleic acid-binding protein
MADYLLDTGILIRHLRNRPGYRELMYRLAQEGRLYIASFTPAGNRAGDAGP